MSGTATLENPAIRFDNAARALSGRDVFLFGNVGISPATSSDVNLTVTASGTLNLNGVINTGASNLALTGRGGIFLLGALTLSGRDITLTGDAQGNRDVTITASGTLRINSNITLTEAGALSLTSTGGLVRILADITTGGALTLSGSTGINLNGGTAKTLSGAAIMLTGTAQSNRNLTITAAGVLTLNSDIIAGTRVLLLSGSDGIALGGALTLTGRFTTLTGAATGTANLTLTASGTLTLNDNITLTGDNLTLALSGADALVGTGTPTLTASTISLTQAEEFAAIAVFGFTATSLTLSRMRGRQTIHSWMQNALTGGSLTITATGVLIVREGFDFGDNNITLTSGGIVRIGADITTTGDINLTGVASSTQPAIRFERGARVVTGRNIMLNGSAGVLTSTTAGASGGNVTLTAASGILSLNGNVNTSFTAADGAISFGDLTLTGATIQIGRRGSDRLIELSGGDITLTSTSDDSGILLGRFTGARVFLVRNRVANLTVTAQGMLTIAANITVDSTATSGGDIALTGRNATTPINFTTGARTITGRAITLSGAATGTANLTLDARGTLTLNDKINIGTNALTLTSGVGAIGNGGTATTLTASTVSLRQDAVFSTAGPFSFGGMIGSLLLTTEAEQEVHDWMIASDRNLTVTSSDRVRVGVAIGVSEPGRSLGMGDITLTSTGADIRIQENISTTGNITLSGGTGGINFNGRAAKILRGAIVTLTGNARSNRDLTLNATTFALGDTMSTINVGANMLTINAGSNLPSSLTGNDRLTSGTLTLSFPCPNTTCVDTGP